MVVKLKIKRGDSVKVVTDDDKGKTGKVLAMYPKTLKAVVEGRETAKRAIKPSKKSPNGGPINKEMPMNISDMAKIRK